MHCSVGFTSGNVACGDHDGTFVTQRSLQWIAVKFPREPASPYINLHGNNCHHCDARDKHPRPIRRETRSTPRHPTSCRRFATRWQKTPPTATSLVEPREVLHCAHPVICMGFVRSRQGRQDSTAEEKTPTPHCRGPRPTFAESAPFDADGRDHDSSRRHRASRKTRAKTLPDRKRKKSALRGRGRDLRRAVLWENPPRTNDYRLEIRETQYLFRGWCDCLASKRLFVDFSGDRRNINKANTSNQIRQKLLLRCECSN